MQSISLFLCTHAFVHHALHEMAREREVTLFQVVLSYSVLLMVRYLLGFYLGNAGLFEIFFKDEFG